LPPSGTQLLERAGDLGQVVAGPADLTFDLPELGSLKLQQVRLKTEALLLLLRVGEFARDEHDRARATVEAAIAATGRANERCREEKTGEGAHRIGSEEGRIVQTLADRMLVHKRWEDHFITNAEA
jgi:hypothetical protein